jgi:DNA-binding response OmpR family regulator
MSIRPLALLVDDESSILEELVWHLEQRGWDVLTATDGLHGVALWQKHANTLNLVVTDIRMPGIQGQALVQQIGSQRKQIRPAVFIMTAYDDVSREDAHNIGADAIFQKPFRVRELVAAAQHFMKVASGTGDSELASGPALTLAGSKIPQ